MDGQEKFDTCMYRSKEQHFTQEVYCCGASQKMGFLCIRKLLDNVTPAICEGCIFYQSKINVENKKTGT